MTGSQCKLKEERYLDTLVGINMRHTWLALRARRIRRILAALDSVSTCWSSSINAKKNCLGQHPAILSDQLCQERICVAIICSHLQRRLRVVPIFPQGSGLLRDIVERAKRERAWKITPSEKGETRGRERNSHRRVSPFSRGMIFTRALLSLRKNGDYSYSAFSGNYPAPVLTDSPLQALTCPVLTWNSLTRLQSNDRQAAHLNLAPEEQCVSEQHLRYFSIRFPVKSSFRRYRLIIANLHTLACQRFLSHTSSRHLWWCNDCYSWNIVLRFSNIVPITIWKLDVWKRVPNMNC